MKTVIILFMILFTILTMFNLMNLAIASFCMAVLGIDLGLLLVYEKNNESEGE